MYVSYFVQSRVLLCSLFCRIVLLPVSLSGEPRNLAERFSGDIQPRNSARIEQTLLVGYQSETIYRVWDKESGKVFTSSNVIFPPSTMSNPMPAPDSPPLSFISDDGYLSSRVFSKTETDAAHLRPVDDSTHLADFSLRLGPSIFCINAVTPSTAP